MIFSWLQTSTNILQLPTNIFLAPTITLISTNNISKIVKNEGSTLQEISDLFTEVIKSTTDFYIMKFFANCLHTL